MAPDRGWPIQAGLYLEWALREWPALIIVRFFVYKRALVLLTTALLVASIAKAQKADDSVKAVASPASVTQPPRSPQTAFGWPNGKRAAIVLTYDDGIQSHLNIAIPQLDEAHLKGTFFLKADNLTPKDMLRWRTAAHNGHELGNHSIYHPCPRASLPQERYASENYNPENMVLEIGIMNDILFGIDGGELRTYAYPCAQSIVGGLDYTEALRRSGFIKYARDGGDQYTSVLTDFTKLDPLHIPSWGFLDHPLGTQLIAYIKRVQDAGGLGVLMFHGVGGDYLEVSADAHRELLTYLQQHPDIWVGTFQEVLDYAMAHRTK